jgi:sugar phosphate isomerase/epimerase
MFRIGLATSPFPTKFGPLLFAGDWQGALQAAAQLGYDALEVSLRQSEARHLDELARSVEEAGLPMCAIATGQSYLHDGLSLVSLDPAKQELLARRMRAFIEFAARWQAVLIIGGIRGRFEPDESTRSKQREAALAAVRSLAAYAAPQGVRLAIEPLNRYETNFLNTIAEALLFVDEVGAPNLGILPDTFHMNIEEPCLAEALKAAAGKIAHVHFADSNRLAPGDGHIDFGELTQVLTRIGYRGYVCAEILPLPDSYRAAQRAMAHLRSLA